MTLGSRVVAPGDSTGFQFRYSMHPGMGGKHHYEVRIDTNDGKHPLLTFHVRANSLEDPSVPHNGVMGGGMNHHPRATTAPPPPNVGKPPGDPDRGGDRDEQIG